MSLTLNKVQQVYDEILLSFNDTNTSSKNFFESSKIARYRRLTIAKATETLLNLYPYTQPYIIWKMIEKAHMINFISKMIQLPEKTLNTEELLDYVLDNNTLTVMTSSAQSWKRASGVAWEEFLQRTLNLSDSSKEIKILNAPEMKSLLNGEPLINSDGILTKLSLPPTDVQYLEFINKVLDDKNFDLFLVYYFPLTQEWKLFGLIQCKTSIRDRLKINMKSSLEAMQQHLWSIVIAMDPDGFTNNTGQYNRAAKDSWNGFYILDNNISKDFSIYHGSLQAIQDIIKSHCLEVLSSMLHQTDSINEYWRPSK